MKTILLTFLFSINAYAGDAKLLWTHDYRATDGSLVTLTGFNFYWRVNGGAETKIQYWPPMPLPYKVVNGMYYFAKTFSHASWVPGATVCFQASAVAGPLESDRTGQVCKTMPLNPSVPATIDVDIP